MIPISYAGHRFPPEVIRDAYYVLAGREAEPLDCVESLPNVGRRSWRLRGSWRHAVSAREFGKPLLANRLRSSLRPTQIVLFVIPADFAGRSATYRPERP